MSPDPALRTDTVPPGVLDRAGLRRVVLVLSTTEITSWGVLYYAFPVLAPGIVRDTGWSATSIAAAFSVGQVVAALTGIGVGRVLDRHGPRVLMTVGSVLAVPALLTIASAPSYEVFLLGWVMAGLSMAAVLYPPAIATLTHWGGPARIGALTTLTLVAGLASTVFAPLTAALDAQLDWRRTYGVLAVCLAVITIPTHWYGLRRPWAARDPGRRDPSRTARPGVWRTRPFLLLALSTSATAFSIYAVVINLVPYLVERGLSTGTAALALGLGGIGQVTGRLGYGWFAAHTAVVSRTVIVLGAVAASTFLLALLPGPLFALLVASMLVGVARGVFTLVQATAISDRWGVAGFGALNGILTAPLLMAAAIAPFAGAAIAAATGSHATSFLILAAVAAAAALTALGTRSEPERTTDR